MAKPAHQKSTNSILKINLLHPQGQQLKFAGRLLSWLLGYGRFIIIVVEIIVIVCFLIRFKLDADIENINKQIETEASSIQSRFTDEVLVNQTQQKLVLIKQTYDTTPDWKDIFAKIISKVPAGVTFNTLSLTHEQSSKAVEFKLTARAASSGDLAAFLNALKESDKAEADRSFSEIDLSGVSLDENLINFNVTGSIK